MAWSLQLLNLGIGVWVFIVLYVFWFFVCLKIFIIEPCKKIPWSLCVYEAARMRERNTWPQMAAGSGARLVLPSHLQNPGQPLCHFYKVQWSVTCVMSWRGDRCVKETLLVCVLVTQPCPTLCDPLDCSPPGFSVRGILQAGILEWVDIPFSRGSSWSKHQTWVSCIVGRFFTIWATREAQRYLWLL